MARKHSSEAFYAPWTIPLSGRCFQFWWKMVKKMDENERSAKASIAVRTGHRI